MAKKANLDFSDTRVAFAARTDNELRHAYLMFRLMGISPLVRLGPKVLTTSLRFGLPISGIMRATIFRQFCGGETLEGCLPTINSLGKAKINTILDYSVEGGATPAAKEATVGEILHTIQFAEKNPLISYSVFKASGLTRPELLEKRDAKKSLSTAEQAEYATFVARVEALCQAAHDTNTRIFIDAEESWLQNSIDDIALSMMRRFNKKQALVYTTVQLYRHDRLAFLKNLAAKAAAEDFYLGVKLVRGAYIEKEFLIEELVNYITDSPIVMQGHRGQQELVAAAYAKKRDHEIALV